MQEENRGVRMSGFSAMLGNPPFLGGQKITSECGTPFREFLVAVTAKQQTGSADLCSYFFLNVFELMKLDGLSGMVATNTIAEGSTREVGLSQILSRGGSISSANLNVTWSGDAAVVVHLVTLKKGQAINPSLDGEIVESINEYLSIPGRIVGDPYRLKNNSKKAFQGTVILGNGFTMTPQKASELIQLDTKYSEVLFPFLDGDSLNSKPQHVPSRWVVNYFNWSKEKAKTYSQTWNHIETNVKPARQKKQPTNATAARRFEKYWIYGSTAVNLYANIGHLERVLAIVLHSNVVMPAWVPINQVYSHGCGVFAFDDDFTFGLLSSQLHWWWTQRYSSSIGHGTRYTTSDVFETFPRIEPNETVSLIAKELNEERAKILLKRDIGLVKLYPLVHDSEINDKDICALRELHRQLDEAVLDAYGWSDVELGYGFHETSMGMRWTISTDAQAEVLDRLLELNHNMFEQEVGQGLWR